MTQEIDRRERGNKWSEGKRPIVDADHIVIVGGIVPKIHGFSWKGDRESRNTREDNWEAQRNSPSVGSVFVRDNETN
jgi:hypothetical protein